MFLIVFCVRKAILSCVSLKILVIRLTSLPKYVKVAHFVFVLGVRVYYVFVIVMVTSQLGLRYIHFFVVYFL
jgi:hypothetical protein